MIIIVAIVKRYLFRLVAAAQAVSKQRFPELMDTVDLSQISYLSNRAQQSFTPLAGWYCWRLSIEFPRRSLEQSLTDFPIKLARISDRRYQQDRCGFSNFLFHWTLHCLKQFLETNSQTVNRKKNEASFPDFETTFRRPSAGGLACIAAVVLYFNVYEALERATCTILCFPFYPFRW